MRRGRWVVVFYVFFSLFLSIQTSFAKLHELSLWQEALQTNSTASVDVPHPHVLLVSQSSLGIDSIPVQNQVIQLFVFNKNKLVNVQEKITNKTGVAGFIFVSEVSETYTVIVINKTNDMPFILKYTTVSL